MSRVHSDALVFFGATGDLAYKKIFPALQAMVKRGFLNVPVVGVARSPWSLDQLRDRVRDSLEKHGGVDPKAFEKLSRLDPAARAVASYNRARIFIYRREYDKAIAEIEKGEKVEPDHPMLKIFRSGVYYYRGDKDAAIELMDKVIKDHPEMDGIKPLYAVYLAGAGKKDEALAQLTGDDGEHPDLSAFSLARFERNATVNKTL